LQLSRAQRVAAAFFADLNLSGRLADAPLRDVRPLFLPWSSLLRVADATLRLFLGNATIFVDFLGMLGLSLMFIGIARSKIRKGNFRGLAH
jgi:hypothetical protein